MEIPQRPGDWTYDFVRALVEHGEPGWYDFKAGLDAPGVDKTACAMANTDGGFVLFGVLNATEHPGRTSTDLIPGNQRDAEFHKHLGDKLNGITPELRWELARLIPHPEKPSHVIPVVSVPKSDRRPHLLRTQNGFYYRARGGTNEPMSYQQIQEQMVQTPERLRKLKLLRLELARYKRLGDRLQGRNLARERERFNTDNFQSLVLDTCSLFPPGSPLIHYLSEIPEKANTTNRFLDDAAMLPGPSQQGFDVSIGGHAWGVRSSCEQCEIELQRLFGPTDAMP
jgi:hypothetical protein